MLNDRYLGSQDPLFTQYNESIYYDRAFYAQDIAGSIAWARANNKSGTISDEEFHQIEQGLGMVKQEWDEGRFAIKPGIDEDIHTANERRLSEIVRVHQCVQSYVRLTLCAGRQGGRRQIAHRSKQK